MGHRTAVQLCPCSGHDTLLGKTRTGSREGPGAPTTPALGQRTWDGHSRNMASDVPEAEVEQVNAGLVAQAAPLLRATLMS